VYMYEGMTCESITPTLYGDVRDMSMHSCENCTEYISVLLYEVAMCGVGSSGTHIYCVHFS